MKRRFASPLLVSHDSLFDEADISTFPKADRCLSQSEMRRFTSPLLVNRDPELDITGSISKSQQSSSSSQLDDRSMEVPKTPNSCPKAESATRTVNRRLFHVSEQHSQRSDILSSAPFRRTTPRPSAFEQANKRVCESRSDDFQKQVGGTLQKSVDLQSDAGENSVLASNAPPFRRQSNYKCILGTTPGAGRIEEFSKPVPNPSVCERRTTALHKKQTPGVCDGDKEASNEEVRQAGELSHELLESELVGRTKTGAPGGSHDVSHPCMMRPETPPKLASENMCSLEVFTCPTELKDIDKLSCHRATILDTVLGPAQRRLAFSQDKAICDVEEGRVRAGNAKDVNSPARSAEESELTYDCMKKLKILLVPSSIPFANLILQNYIPKSFLQMISELSIVHPWNYSSRDSIKEDLRSFEVVQPDSLAEHERVNERVENSLLKTTKVLQEVSIENESHLRGPSHLRDENSNHLQVISDGISNNSSPTTVISPQKSTKSYETIACVQSPKERLSPSSLYAAQSLEFRSIWFSKRLKMAEIAVACLTQTDFLFSTLV